MVRGCPLQLLDSQFGLTCLKRNHKTTKLKPRPTVLAICDTFTVMVASQA